MAYLPGAYASAKFLMVNPGALTINLFKGQGGLSICPSCFSKRSHKGTEPRAPELSPLLPQFLNPVDAEQYFPDANSKAKIVGLRYRYKLQAVVSLSRSCTWDGSM